jgi:hypothetical protein
VGSYPGAARDHVVNDAIRVTVDQFRVIVGTPSASSHILTSSRTE